MKNILLYVEPHPIRNGFDEFSDIGLLLAKALASYADPAEYSFRILCNNSVADKLVREVPSLSMVCIRPTAIERETIVQQYRHWGQEAIADWLALTRGEGDVAAFYETMLQRVYDFFPFDVVLVWSENGAVRNFAKRKQIAVIHGELGPTRAPFRPTVYFDSEGTNGNASVVRAPLSVLDDALTLDPDAWIAGHMGLTNSETEPGVYDVPTTLDVEMTGLLPWRPFVYVVLQLSDDLNTLAHSRFSSPLSFLQAVAPIILEAGYDIVVKPHPAADARPFNLAAESAALRYIRAFGERVQILPRRMDKMANVVILGQAACLCTINSSMAFEAALLGRPSYALGSAAFDVAGSFCISLEEFPAALKAPTLTVEQHTAIAFCLQHTLIPMDLVTEGPALMAVIDFFLTHRGKDVRSEAYWVEWRKVFDFTPYTLDPRRRDFAITASETPMPIAGNIALFRAPKRRIEVHSDRITIRSRFGDRDILACARRNDERFMGSIDVVESKADGSSLVVDGWAVEMTSHVPPIQVMIQAGDDLVSSHRVIHSRPDVREYLDTGGTVLRGFRFEVKVPPQTAVEDMNLLLLSADNEIQMARIIVGDLAASD